MDYGLWTHVINNINSEEIIGTSHEKGLQKTQTKFRIEKVVRKKILYVKCKSYNTSFNTWINEKDLV